MALQITTFKQGQKTYTDVYVKVDRLSIDNEAKKCSFSILGYKSEDDRTLVQNFGRLIFDINPDIEARMQAYGYIANKVEELKAQKAELETYVAANPKDFKKKWELATLNANPLLQLDGAITLD